MSSNFSNKDDDDEEESDEISNAEDENVVEEEEESEEELSEADRDLLTAIERKESANVRKALRNGANVNCSSDEDYVTSPLMTACEGGYDKIVRILLDAGADVRWRYHDNQSAIENA